MGDSKTPFIFLACSSLSNIAMDILFVTAFNMGVAGVAWATFLCQGDQLRAGAVLCAAAGWQRSASRASASRLFSWPHAEADRAVIAVPSILQQSFISVGNIIIQGVINSFGTGVMAGLFCGNQAEQPGDHLLYHPGKRHLQLYRPRTWAPDKPDRVRAGFKAGLRLVWLLCVPLVALYLLCGEALIRFFMNAPSVLAVESGLQLLRVVAPFYFVVSVKLAADGVLRGAEMMRAFMVSTLTDLVLRVALAVFLSGGMGTLGVWSAWPIGWCVATGLSLLFYLRKFKKQPVAA